MQVKTTVKKKWDLGLRRRDNYGVPLSRSCLEVDCRRDQGLGRSLERWILGSKLLSQGFPFFNFDSPSSSFCPLFDQWVMQSSCLCCGLATAYTRESEKWRIQEVLVGQNEGYQFALGLQRANLAIWLFLFSFPLRDWLTFFLLFLRGACLAIFKIFLTFRNIIIWYGD